jgi:hypothetical protein
MTIVEQLNPGFQWAEPLQGEELDVECVSDNLQITGLIPSYEAQNSPCDLIRQYERSPKQVAIGQQTTGAESPEVSFANADTDEKLIAFVRRFGPVVAKSVIDTRSVPDKELGEPRLPGRLIAHQDMEELRNEQAVYRAALSVVMHLDEKTHNYISVQQLKDAIGVKLTEESKQPKFDRALARQLWKIIAESIGQQLGQPSHDRLSVRQLMNVIAANIKEQLDKPNYDYASAQRLMKVIAASIKKHFDQPIYDYLSAQKLMKTIAINIKDWPPQWEREKSLRQREPGWKLRTESLERIQSLSSLPPDPILWDQVSGRIVICELLNAFRSTVFPNPLEMHSSIKFGIRPLLYSLLRRQFIQPRSFAICANTQCRNFFNIGRAGQQFCSPECSIHHRQRLYWEKRGKKLRKKRTSKLQRKEK